MGNHRFRLSDMMPNAWFYKLKDMNQPQRNNPPKKPPTNSPPPQNHHHHRHHPPPPPSLVPNRASYYFPSNSPVHPKAFDTPFPLDSPRKSTPHRPHARTIPAIVTSSSSSSSPSPTFRGSVSESDSAHSYRVANNVARDIVLDVVGPELELRPILTKPAPPPPPVRRARAAGSPRRRRRRTSKVRVVRRRPPTTGGLSESFAVVKSSSDPKADFRDSMAEMVAENGLCSSGELEDLLACFLSLNSAHYHDVIVEAFQEIWFQFTSTHSLHLNK